MIVEQEDSQGAGGELLIAVAYEDSVKRPDHAFSTSKNEPFAIEADRNH